MSSNRKPDDIFSSEEAYMEFLLNNDSETVDKVMKQHHQKHAQEFNQLYDKGQRLLKDLFQTTEEIERKLNHRLNALNSQPAVVGACQKK